MSSPSQYNLHLLELDLNNNDLNLCVCYQEDKNQENMISPSKNEYDTMHTGTESRFLSKKSCSAIFTQKSYD